MDRDETGAILGWRAWSITTQLMAQWDAELTPGRLSSLTLSGTWPRGVIKARCNRRQPHLAPDDRCTCGLYAFADPAELTELSLQPPCAVGVVRCWGRVVFHQHGWRSQFMEVQSLFAYGAHPDRVDALSRHYEVPVIELMEYPILARSRKETV